MASALAIDRMATMLVGDAWSGLRSAGSSADRACARPVNPPIATSPTIGTAVTANTINSACAVSV